jgi:hypothetical protein
MSIQDFDIRISLSENFSQPEYQQAAQLFADFGKVDVRSHIRESAEELFAILIITFVTLPFANGYFGKMGEDAYAGTRKKIAEFIAKRRHATKPTQAEHILDYNEFEVHALVVAEDATVADEALSRLSGITEILERMKSNGTLPSPADRIFFEFDKVAGSWRPVGATSTKPFAKHSFDVRKNAWQLIFKFDV